MLTLCFGIAIYLLIIHTTNPLNGWSNLTIPLQRTTGRFPCWHSPPNPIRDKCYDRQWDSNRHEWCQDLIPMDWSHLTFSARCWRHSLLPIPYKRPDRSACNLSFLERMVCWLNRNNECSIILQMPASFSLQSIDTPSFRIVIQYSRPIHVVRHLVWSIRIL